jgi:5-methylcytosine-specific restriction protein A
MRRSPLKRKTPLARGAPFKRKPKVALGRPRPRDTGPSEDTTQILWARAKGCCEICGRNLANYPHSKQHRLPRKAGGTRRPEINLPSNLLLLCGTATSPGDCHDYVERVARGESYVMGWLVPEGRDPAKYPVLRRGVRVLLDDAGVVRPVTGEAV